MALNDVTINFDLSQILGADFDSRRTKAYVTTNVENATLMDTSTGETRMGDQAVTVASDGTGSFTTWGIGTDGNPVSWQTSLIVDYPRTGQRDRKHRTFGPYTITDADDGKNITDLEEEQAIPPNYQTAFTASMVAIRDETEALRDEAAALIVSDLGTTDGQTEFLINNPSLTQAAIAAAIAARADGLDLATKQGTVYQASALAAPTTDDTPTVTVATTTAISGGTTVVPTNDYVSDPAFRYDGCADVTIAAGVAVPVQPTAAGATYTIVAEFVTSQGCDKADPIFTLNSAGATFGVRITVNDKMVTLPMTWFSATASTVYYVRLAFPTAKARQIRVETVNASNFKGVVVPSGETVTRPPREVRKRAVLWGDSYTKGANGNTTSNPATNGTSLFETGPYFAAKLLGCDSIINLGIGGTGWVVAGGGDSTFGQRIADILAASPHVVLACGSRNDSTSTGPLVYAAAVSALTQLADVPVVEVCGIMDDGSGTGTTPAVLNEAVKQAARTTGRPFHDMLGVVTPALKNSFDNVHPSVVGAEVLGKTLYSSLDRARIDESVAGAVGGRPSVDLTLSASPSYAAAVGATITLTAVQSTARAGKVAFYANGVLLSTSTLASGTATYATSALAAGTYTLTARYLPTSPLLVKSSTSNVISGYTVSANLGFSDTFTRADGPVGSTENGKAYTTSGSGTFSVSSNKLVNTGVVSGTSHCVADAGSPNGTFSFTLGGTVTGVRGLLRWSSTTNFLAIVVVSSQIVIQETVNGAAAATLFTGASGGWSSGDVISVVLAGDTITVKKNGTNVTNLAAVTVTRFNTNTKFGIGIGSSGSAATIDGLTFVAA